MGMMLNFSDDKVTDISENLEQGLRYIGKAMQCVDGMKKERGMMGQRVYGGRMYHRDDMGMRDDEIGYRGYMGYRMPDYRDPMMY